MMSGFWARKTAFLSAEAGATAIEYGLIVAGVAVTISAIVFSLGDTTFLLYENVSNFIIERI
jgi:pilus assembly protein Flp/PilA